MEQEKENPDGESKPEADASTGHETAGEDKPAPVKPDGKGGWLKQDGSRRILIGVGAAIVAVLIVGAFFAIGFAVGNHEGNEGRLKGPAFRQELRDRLQDRRQLRNQQARDLLDQEGTDILKGSVTAVDGKKVTIQTAHGAEVFNLTAQTRSPRMVRGAPGVGGGEPPKLAPGQQVTVVVKKAADGSWEALGVRIPGQK